MSNTQLNKILASKKVRLTPFRVAVLEIIANCDTAIGLGQIEEELVDFDRVTLYRTIKTFVDQGVIHEITLPGVEKKLALCDHDCQLEEQGHLHQHVHFKCTICEQVYCVELSRFPDIQLEGFDVSSIELNATGVCQKCKN